MSLMFHMLIIPVGQTAAAPASGGAGDEAGAAGEAGAAQGQIDICFDLRPEHLPMLRKMRELARLWPARVCRGRARREGWQRGRDRGRDRQTQTERQRVRYSERRDRGTERDGDQKQRQTKEG